MDWKHTDKRVPLLTERAYPRVNHRAQSKNTNRDVLRRVKAGDPSSVAVGGGGVKAGPMIPICCAIIWNIVSELKHLLL